MRPLLCAATLPLLILLPACNDVPEGAVVVIEPAEPTTVDDLTVVLQTPATDKQELTYRYDWALDGQAQPAYTGDTVPSSATDKGQTWSVVVTPNDGKVDGVTAEASVIVRNTPPTVSVSLSPSAPATVDALVASASTQDSDDDTVTLTWSWTRDGAAVPDAGDTVAASSTRKGEVWQVTVTPNDGEEDGEPASAQVTIANTRPVAAGVTLDPSLARVGTTVRALAEGSDADNDSLTWTYTWFVGSAMVQSGAEGSLSGRFAKGDTLRVEAQANDGEDDSNIVISDVLTIANTPPALASATVSPPDPTVASVLSCLPSDGTDADGDTITYTTTWNVNGRELGEASSLDSSSFRKGDPITCTLTPFDGTDAGTPVTSDVITVLNTAPTVGGATIAPSPARTADTLSVSPSGVADADGDDVGFTYAWTVNGAAASTASTLSASAHAKGDVVEVEVIPDDGTDTGLPVTASITIANTAPTAPAIAIDPTDPMDEEDLICDVVTASTDADGDRITYTFTWTVNGSRWTGSTLTTTYAGDTIDEANTTADDKWSCTLVASDGTDSASPVTSADATVAGTRDGQVRMVSGTWIDVQYERCGSGTSCTASDARTACSNVGLKVVSHASNGSSTVKSLGATASCQWSTSYFTTDKARASGECLVGISNLDWSSCCGTSTWHGNTIDFGSAGSVFGYVNSGNSGYVSTYANASGQTWGCQSLTSAATVRTSCSSMWVACAP